MGLPRPCFCAYQDACATSLSLVLHSFFYLCNNYRLWIFFYPQFLWGSCNRCSLCSTFAFSCSLPCRTKHLGLRLLHHSYHLAFHASIVIGYCPSTNVATALAYWVISSCAVSPCRSSKKLKIAFREAVQRQRTYME